MKWLQQKWYDVSIRTKSILLMGMMLAVTWVLVALVMIQLHTFSERSSVIMNEYDAGVKTSLLYMTNSKELEK